METECNEKSIPMLGKTAAGNTLTNLRLIRGGESDKWLIPPYNFGDDVPVYQNGHLFTIPRWSVPCLDAAMWSSPFVIIDDIHFGGILAQACNITRMNIDSWNGHGGVAIPGQEVREIKFNPDTVMWHLGYTKFGADCKHRFYKDHLMQQGST